MTGDPHDVRAASMKLLLGGFCALVLLYVVAVPAMSLYAGFFAADAGTGSRLEAGMLAQGTGSLAVLACARFWRPGVPLRGDGRVLWPIAVYFAFLVVWVPVGLIGVPTLWQAMGWPIEAQPHLHWFSEPHDMATLCGVLAFVCLIGPAFEELLFRGYLQTGLTGLIGPRGALTATAVVFGLFHVGDGWYLFVPLALLGWLFGFLRQRTGGLMAPILAHAIHNSLTIGVVMLFPGVEETVFGR